MSSCSILITPSSLSMARYASSRDDRAVPELFSAASSLFSTSTSFALLCSSTWMRLDPSVRFLVSKSAMVFLSSLASFRRLDTVFCSDSTRSLIELYSSLNCSTASKSCCFSARSVSRDDVMPDISLWSAANWERRATLSPCSCPSAFSAS